MKGTEGACIYCTYGNSSEEDRELERIHDLAEEQFGNMSEMDTYSLIAETYDRRIRQPLLLQKEITKRRTGVDIPVPPEWPVHKVAEHFIKHGLYARRRLGRDIIFSDLLLEHLQYHGIMKENSSTHEKEIDFENLKVWLLLSKHKFEITKNFYTLFPNVNTKQGETQRSRKVQK